MATTSYEHSVSQASTRERGARLWRSGADLRALGAACFLGVLPLAVYGALEWPEVVVAFGSRIGGPKTTLVWACLMALMLGIGYGFTFHQGWVWDMTLATMGFLAASEVLNERVWGVTLAGVSALLMLGLAATYLIWRRPSIVPVEAPVLEGRSRRGRRD